MILGPIRDLGILHERVGQRLDIDALRESVGAEVMAQVKELMKDLN